MYVLNNGWVIGIGTGIISGLLVALLLRISIKKKKTSEYRQRIVNANRDIVYSIRTGIPDNALPQINIINALINSTARRYNVESNELYQAKEVIEELIKEVMDSTFISSVKKLEYCVSLTRLEVSSPQNEGELAVTGNREYLLKQAQELENRKQALQLQLLRVKSTKGENLTIIMAGIFAALITALLSKTAVTSFTLSSLQPVTLIVLSIPLIIVVAFELIDSQRRIKRYKSQITKGSFLDELDDNKIL